MAFKAVRVSKAEAGQTVGFVEAEDADLMDGDVTVRVTHSTVNYKDGLALSGKSPIPRKFPMFLGIDFAGVVETSSHPSFQAGDEVVCNGFGLGETHSGGYAQKARVKGDWLVKLPAPFSRAQAMAIGTAGYTAALAVEAVMGAGASPGAGPAIVTGAAGGVGSVAIALLAKAGFQIIASTGRAEEADYLRELGATEIVDRATLSAAGKPLAKERWIAGVDKRRLPHAGQRPVPDALSRRSRRLRPCGRHGPAGIGRAFHPARRATARDRQRQLPDEAPALRLVAARPRSRSRKARPHDANHSVRAGVRNRRRDSERAGQGPRRRGGWLTLRRRRRPARVRCRATRESVRARTRASSTRRR